MSVFGEKLSEIAASGNLRTLPDVIHDGRYIVKDGKRMLNLSSNDYLGLASGPESRLMQDFLSAVSRESHSGLEEEFLLSSSSSRLLTGNFRVYRHLEDMLCRLSGRETALVFSSGYHLNIGILPAVSDSSTVIIADKLVHASIIDGMRLSSARTVRYRHQDMSQLESLVSKYSNEAARVIVVTESIFSMDGDVSDLAFMAGLKKRYPGVMLYVDEAHAIGVRGDTGMGVAQEQGVTGDIDFLCGTFGKAVASAGAYVLCDAQIRDYLVNRMRSLIFTTALPPLNVLWTAHVLENLAGMDHLRKTLSGNAARLRTMITAAGLPCPSGSHIIPVMAGDSNAAVKLALEMQDKGFYLLPVRPPTVPEGTARLRISLTASVSDGEISSLASALGLK